MAPEEEAAMDVAQERYVAERAEELRRAIAEAIAGSDAPDAVKRRTMRTGWTAEIVDRLWLTLAAQHFALTDPDTGEPVTLSAEEFNRALLNAATAGARVALHAVIEHQRISGFEGGQNDRNAGRKEKAEPRRQTIRDAFAASKLPPRQRVGDIARRLRCSETTVRRALANQPGQ